MASSGGEGAPNVHDVAMAAVTAAASAAAAAAAAAVVAAAGRDIEARIQAAPPNGFPFYGMPPSLLRPMSSNPPLNQLNPQATSTRDARGMVGMGSHREAGAEATGTSEPGRQHHPAQVHGEDGEDSACSRENEDGAGQLKETASDGNRDNNNMGNVSDFTRQMQHSGGSNLAARFLSNPSWQAAGPLNTTYMPPPTSMWGPQYSDPGSIAAAAQLWSIQPASQEGIPGPLTFHGATTTTHQNNNNIERTIASLPPKPLSNSKSRKPTSVGDAENNKHQADVQKEKEVHSNGGNNGGGSGGSTADDGRSKLPRGQQPGTNANPVPNTDGRTGNEPEMPEGSGSNPTGNGNGNGGSSGNDSIHPNGNGNIKSTTNNGNGNGHSSKMTQPVCAGGVTLPKPSNGTGNGSSGRGSNEGANTTGNGSGQNPTNGNGSSQNPNGSGTGHHHHHHRHHHYHHHHKRRHNTNSIDNNNIATNNNHASNNRNGDASNGNGATNGNGVHSKIRPLPPPPPPPPRSNGGSGEKGSGGDKNSGEDGGTGGSGEKGSGGDKAGSGEKGGSGGNGSGGNGSGGNHSTADGTRMGQSRRKTSPQEPASGAHQAAMIDNRILEREDVARRAPGGEEEDDDDGKQDCQSDSPSNKQMTGTSQGNDAFFAEQVVHVHAVQAAMHAIQSVSVL